MAIVSVQYNGSASGTVAFTSNNTVGNFLVAVGRGLAAAPTDSAGNTWAYIVGTQIAYCPSCKGGANTVTTGATSCAVAEYSGMRGYAPTQISSGAATSATYDSGSITTIAAALLVGKCSNETANGLTFTPAGGFTQRAVGNGNTLLTDQITNAAGTYDNTGTSSSSVVYTSNIVAFTSVPLVQFKQQPLSTGAASPIVFALPNTAGNMLCLGGRGAVTAVSDSAGNTWTQSAVNSNFWYVLNCKGGANSVTFTGGNNQIWIAEFANVVAYDRGAAPHSATSTAWTSGAVTPAENNALVIAFVFNASSNSDAPVAGVALPFNLIGWKVGGQVNAIGEFAIQAVKAAVTPDMSGNSVAYTMGAEVFVYAPPSGGGGNSSWLTVNQNNSLRGLRH